MGCFYLFIIHTKALIPFMESTSGFPVSDGQVGEGEESCIQQYYDLKKAKKIWQNF